MNRKIMLACVAVCLVVVGLWLLTSGIAQAADPPLAPGLAYSLLNASGATVTPTLNLSEPLTPTPAYTMTVSEGMTASLPLRVHNPLTSQVTVTTELVEVLPATTFDLSPVSQTVAAEGTVTFTLSLVKPPSAAGSYTYTGTLRLSTDGPGLTPTKTITQSFGLLVSVSPLERAGVVLTPTLRLSGPKCETLLSSRPVYRVVVSDEGWQPVSLHVCNLAEEQVTIVPRLLEVSPTGGEAVPALLAISPVSQTVAENGGVVSFTLTLVEGWLPEGKYQSTLNLSPVSTETAAVEQEFDLLVTPWRAQLEWAQHEFVYVADAEHETATVRVVARYADAENPHAEVTVLARKGVTEPVTFSTAGFLSVSDTEEVLAEDKVVPLTLNFTPAELPEPGAYEGTLRLSASNAASITGTFTLVVPEDRARGFYKIRYAELGQTPVLSSSLPLTTALQFTGVRWLPGSTRVAGDWWPAVIGALLLGVGVAVLAGYTAWALAVPKPKDKKLEDKNPEGKLQKACAWVKKYWWVNLGIGVGVSAFIVVYVLSPRLKLTQATVGDRKLLIWEAAMRGPVRDVRMQPGEVVNETGDTGEIVIGQHNGEIKARDVLTVPDIGIQELSQPGVYQGRILIHSPDIAGGVVEVPVQTTVHDFILWPALLILLGVVLGGWAKYQQGIAGQRLEKQRDIEQVWQKWDDYMPHDDYLWPPSTEGVREINPIYKNVRWDLEYARELLAEESEWGMEDAHGIVSDVGERLTTYQRLAKAVTDWREEQERETDETSKQQLQKWIDKVANALYRGELDQATDLMGKMGRKTLPIRIRRLENLAKTLIDDEAKKAIQALLEEARKLYEKEKYGEAWLKFKEADYEIRAQGLEVPLFALSLLEPRSTLEELVGIGLMTRDVANAILGPLPEGMVSRLDFESKVRSFLGTDETRVVRQRLGLEGYAVLDDPPEPTERYVIRSPAWMRRCVRDTVSLRVEYQGEDTPPKDVKFQWRIHPSETAEYEHETTDPENEIQFRQKGSYKVTVTVKQDSRPLLNDKQQPDPLEFQIEPSGMEAIYRDKRRHNFKRRLAAGLLALVGGMAAQKVFGLTFGSFKEYLYAFSWGIGVSAGVDPIADGYDALKGQVGKLLKLAPKQGGTSQQGQTGKTEETGTTKKTEKTENLG